MNKAYRLIWSKAKDAWVIVAEIVKGNGGPPPITVTAVMVAAGLALASVRAEALPVSPTVVNGTVAFSTVGNTLTITNSPNSIINWQTFNIGVAETTQFNQQNAASAVLNRVIGGGSYSEILGTLNSNGRVFLLNPNGILFGAGSQVNVAGLVASSLGIADNDFKAGRYNFTDGATAGSVVNQGAITTAAGGKVWLIAPQVENGTTGIITAPNGDIILAAGQSVNMIDPNNPEIAVVVNNSSHTALNLGEITAQAGRVGIFGGLIDQQGTISANAAVAGTDGRIFLKSTNGTTLRATSVTTADAGSGGSILIESSGGTVTQSGEVSASSYVDMKADSMDFAGGGSVTAPYVYLNRFNSGAINLGSEVSGELSLENTELGTISAAGLYIGNSWNTTGMTVSAPITLSSSTPNLSLTAESILLTPAVTGPPTAPAGSLTATGSISLAADSMTLAGGAIDAPIVTLTRSTWGDINLGSAPGGTLSLLQGDLDAVSYTGGGSGVLRVGDLQNTDTIHIGAAIARSTVNNDADNNTLHLISNGNITQSATLDVTNLALDSYSNVTLDDTGNKIANLAANAYWGDIRVTSSDPLNVGIVDEISGINTYYGLTLQADRIDISQPVYANNVTLVPLDVARPVDLITGTKATTPTTLEFTDVELNNISADSLTIGNTGNTGGMTVGSGAIDLAVNNLYLNTGGIFGQTGTLSAAGSISIVADTMSLSGGLTSSTVNLARATSGPIYLGSKPTGAGLILGLTETELQTITASNLYIGDTANTTGMTVSAAINLTGVSNLNLTTGGEPTSDYTFRQTATSALSATGSISINADAMSLGSTISAHDVNLARASSGSIDLGASGYGGTLNLTDAALGTITTTGSGALRIGDTANTSGITISSPITRTAADQDTLHLISGGSISQADAVNALTVTNLALESQGNIGLLNASNNISNLAANTSTSYGGYITIVNNNSLNVTYVDGVSGITTPDAPINVTVTGGTLNLNAGISAGTGDVTLTSAAMDLASGTVSGATVTLASEGDIGLVLSKDSGLLELTQADLDAVTANNLVIQSQASGGQLAVSADIALDSNKTPILTLSADTMLISNALSNTGGTITLRPYSVFTDIDMGSKNEGPLGLLNSELDKITANNLIIENSVGGNITVSDSITLDSSKLPTLTLSADKMDFYTAPGSITYYTDAAKTDIGGGTIALRPYTSTIGFGVGTLGVRLDPTVTTPSSDIGWSQINAATRVIGDTTMSGDITVAEAVGITTPLGSNLSLVTGGYINIKAPLSTGPKNLTLYSDSSVTQDSQGDGTIDSPITAAGLELLGSGTHTLTHPMNSVVTLAGDTGAVSFTNNKNLTIGEVGSSYGLYSDGNLSLKTTGTSGITINAPLTSWNNLTLDSGGSVTQGVNGPIYAGNLQLLGVGGSYDLRNPGNYIYNLYGNTGSVKLLNSRTLSINAPLTTTGDIDLTAVGEAGENGIQVLSAINAANVSLNGTGGDGATGGEGHLGNGVFIGDNITSGGNVTIIGKGGRGVDRTDAPGERGGSGIYINWGSSIVSNGSSEDSIVLKGTGGRGGDSFGTAGSTSGGSGGDARGGDGGIGVNNYRGTIGTTSMDANISIVGIGGAGGNATGGNGGSNNYGNGGSGGNATGGTGGVGIAIGVRSDYAGYIYSGSGNITLNGQGGNGGWGRGGDGGGGGLGFTGGIGGDGFGGAGGIGIRMQGYSGEGTNYSAIRTDIGAITLLANVSTDVNGDAIKDVNGYYIHDGGNGGNGFGGNGGAGRPGSGSSGSGFGGGIGGNGNGGAGGDGINLGYSNIFSGSGQINLYGMGGNGGEATGGDGGTGGALSGAGGWSIGGAGGDGGSANGGSGGRGIAIASYYRQSDSSWYSDDSHIRSDAGAINLTGIGGAGGMGSGGNGGTGGAGIAGDFSGGTGGSGGFGGNGGNGSGGDGGYGIELESAGSWSNVNNTYISSNGATINLNGSGGAGGDGHGGLGGTGGLNSVPGYGFEGGYARGGDGATGIFTSSYSSIFSPASSSTITLAGIGGKGGDALGGKAYSSGSGGGATGGEGSYGINHHGKVGYEPGDIGFTGAALNVVFKGTGGHGGNATGGNGGVDGGSGGWANGGNGGYGTYLDGGSIYTGSGNIAITGIAGNGGFGKGGDAGNGAGVYGGDGNGGDGGRGVRIWSANVESDSGNINITGIGGNGGYGRGGNAGTGGFGGDGYGGKGDYGIKITYGSNIYSFSGNITLLANIETNPDGSAKKDVNGAYIHTGSDGGSGFGGNGGAGGGKGRGGDGYDGIYIYESHVRNSHLSGDGPPVYGNITLTATGGNGGSGTGGNALVTGNGGNGYGGNGGRGIYLDNSTISSSYGAINLTGYGGSGGLANGGSGAGGGFGGSANDSNDNFGRGGIGIHLNYSGIYSDSGAITLNGFGGAGGNATGVDGGKAWGGSGGRGISMEGYFDAGIGKYYTAKSNYGSILLIGTGGAGGNATGGSNATGVATGAAYGGAGGDGVVIGSSGGYGLVYTDTGNITLEGHGGAGGWAEGGAGTGGFSGGYAKGGSGGAGIKVQGTYYHGDGTYFAASTVSSQSGNINFYGYGGLGGYATGGAGGSGAAGGNATGGTGGSGIVIGGSYMDGYAHANISSNSGHIFMYGSGNNGGWARGGVGGSGFNGGDANGGSGGHGIEVQGLYYEGNHNSIIRSQSNYITMNGFGGNGGEATGGAGGLNGNRGSALGGNGGIGLFMHDYVQVYNYAAAINLYGKGGDGGKATGGGSGFGSGTGGDGGAGIHLGYYTGVETRFNWSYGDESAPINISGRGGAGGIGTGSPSSSGGLGAAGINIYSYGNNTYISSGNKYANRAAIVVKAYGGAGGASSDGTGGAGGIGLYVKGSTSNYWDPAVINSYDSNSSLDITANGGVGGIGAGGAGAGNDGAHGIGLLDAWTGGEGSIKASVATVRAEGGISSLRGNVDTVTLTNGVSGDIDYTDAYDDYHTPYAVTVSARNSAPAATGGAVYISSDYRDIAIGADGMSATTRVELTAQNGAITQYTNVDTDPFVSGSIVTPVLVTDSAYGTNLSNPANEVGMFGAYNGYSGDITLVNSIPLAIDSGLFLNSIDSNMYGVLNESGSVNITNTGNISIPLATGAGIYASTDVNLTANSGSVTSDGGITATNQLTVNAATGITLTGDNQSPIVSLNNSTSGDVVYSGSVAAGLTVNGSNAANFTISEISGAPLTVGSGGIATDTGTVSLTADSLNFAGAVTSVSGDVNLKPFTVGTAIGVDASALAFNVTNDILTSITTTGTVVIGDATAGAITAAADNAVSQSGKNIKLQSGSTINIGDNGISVSNLTLQAGGDITQTGAITAGATSLTGGNITLGSANVLGALTVNAGTGNVAITENDAITVAGITHTGTLGLNAGTNDITQTGAITAGATNLTGGNITLNNAGNDFVGDLSVTGGTTSIKAANTLTAHLMNSTASTDLTAVGALTVDGTSGNLTTTSAGLTFGSGMTSLAGNLVATSTGAVNQTGKLTVTGTGSISAGTNAVTLADTTNSFDGALTVTGGTTSIKAANALTAHLTTGITDLTSTGALTVDGTSGNLTTNSAGLTFGSGATTVNGNLVATSAGAISITGTITAAGGGAVNLTASGTSGSITESGSGLINTTGTLTTSSVTGETLNGANTVSTFNATNTTSGDIVMTNTAAPLTITGISNTGSIKLDNTGETLLTGPVESTGSTVTFAAHSPLTVDTSSNITGYGNVNLSAGPSGLPNDNLLINGSVTSQNGDINLMAGGTIAVNGTLAAPNGSILFTSNMNNHLTSLTAALLPEVSLVTNNSLSTMGSESTDLSDEEKLKEDATSEGENHGTEFRALPFCN
jgi:filamentous hemagglutinin family protein